MKQAAIEILADWRVHTRQQLYDGFRLLLDNVGETLVDFASKTESMELQTSFFDAQHILARQRERLLTDFQRELERLEVTSEGSNPGVGSETLSLLERDAYEGSVALETIANNCIQRNQQNFHALCQRVSAVYGGRRCEVNDLPLNPRDITTAFDKATCDLEIASKVRLILFTLFDRYVMRQMDGTLSAINQQLAEAGVLPTIKYEIKKPAASSDPLRVSKDKASASTPAGMSAANTPDRPPGPEADTVANRSAYAGLDETAPTAEQTMDAITELISTRRRRQQHSTSADEAPPSIPISPQESRKRALQALNSPQVSQQAAANPAMDVLTDPRNKIVIDKELLLRVRNTLKKQRALINSLMGGSGKIAEKEQNAIEIVGMLFEAMLDDRTLPDQLKALLSHLHTPYIKIAIKDPGSLSNTQHPARRLLGNMLQLGLRWVDPERLRSGLYPTLQHIVHAIIESPDSVNFEELEDELERKAMQLEKAKKTSEKRALDTEKGKTMLSRAREMAESATQALLQSHALPAPARIFFLTVFTDFLSLLLLRNELNPSDPQCREALQAAVNLIENIDHRQVTAAQQAGAELKRLIETLLPHYQNKIDLFLGNLEHTITSAEREQSGSAGASGEPSTQAAPAVDEATAARILEIAPGSWFILQENPEEQGMMVKLLWSNPHTHHLLFVDQHGLKRAHLHMDQVASYLDKGILKSVDIKSEGVLSRLLSTIRRRLEATLAAGTES